MALSDSGIYPWPDFSARLAQEIAAEGAAAGPETYYARWLDALEHLLVERGVLTHEEVNARHHEYEAGLRTDDD